MGRKRETEVLREKKRNEGFSFFLKEKKIRVQKFSDRVQKLIEYAFFHSSPLALFPDILDNKNLFYPLCPKRNLGKTKLKRALSLLWANVCSEFVFHVFWGTSGFMLSLSKFAFIKVSGGFVR